MDIAAPFPPVLDTAALRHRLTTMIRQHTEPPVDADAGQARREDCGPSSLPLLSSVLLDLDDETFIHPSNRLIDSPSRIAPSQLQPFLNGTTALRLIFPDKTVCRAVLRATHPTSLIVETQQPIPDLRLGDLVLVIFPVATRLRYVLQTVIKTQSAVQLHLAYGDSRYDVRYRIQQAIPVALTVVPPTLVPVLRGHHTRAVRDLYGPPKGTFPRHGGTIIESLCATPPESAALDMPNGCDAPAHASQLHDISLGGVCLALPETLQIENLLSLLFYLNIPLPRILSVPSGEESLPLQLSLFGLIRGIRTTPAPGTLHLRFLKRLPAELEAYFAALAEYSLEPQTCQL